MKKLITFLVALVAVLSIGLSLWYKAALESVDSADESRITFLIEKGETVSAIADKLEEKGIIRSAFAFKLYSKFSDTAHKIQAGKFVLKKTYTVQDLIEILQSGRAEEMIITIPEGFTVSDIDALLAEKGFIEAGEFSTCAHECDLSDFPFLPDGSGLAERGGKVEGYLYPDTYFVIADNVTAESFMRRLLRTFDSKIMQGLKDYVGRSERSLQEVISMASLIEEEAANDEERPMISGILWNRYDAGQGLGVDATVRYILNKPTAGITVADLNVNSPYNTRKFKGLPPGPIASPGYQSILAALSPKNTDYWYYLHGRDGIIRYAKTNTEHNQNKFQYLR